MKKLWKLIPVFAIGIIAAIGAAGCAETGNETAERAATAKPVAAAVRTAAVYAAEDSSCEHDYEATQTFAATCTEQGYTVYTCTNCGDSYTDNFVAAKGHTYIANALKLLDANQSADIIKIDRPVNLDGFAKDIFDKLSALRESDEYSDVKDIRRGILQERIDRIDKLNNIRKQYLSDYYIVVYGRNELSQKRKL